MMKFAPANPTTVSLSPQMLITTSYLEERSFPLVVRPRVEGINLPTWSGLQRNFIERELVTHGAILFRDFGVNSVDDLRKFAVSVSNELLNYSERSSPRTELAEGIYTSTDHPAHQPIALHNEQSYTLKWPMKIIFCCLQPAQWGGRTPIADSRKIFQSLDQTIVREFSEKQLMYVRNYNQGLGLTWQEAFQTSDRRQVERHCRSASIEWLWQSDNCLRTWQIRPAVRRHPTSQVPIWFNHLYFFSAASLEASLRESMLSILDEEDLPYHTKYGDGTPIEPSVLAEIASVYVKETVSFDWRQGDVLLLDNMSSAHGREPFGPPRRVVAAMCDSFAAR